MKWKGFIEKQKHNLQLYRQEGKGKDLEYGRYCGKLAGINEILERDELDVDPLQSAIRMCPAFGAICLGNFVPDCYSIVHGTEGCAYLLKVFMDGYQLVFQDRGNIFSMPSYLVQ